jgi:hypothetical protein
MTDETPEETRYRRAVELAERSYQEIPTDSLISRGSRGGLRVHPALGVWIRANRAAIEFGKAIGAEEDHSKGPMGRPVGAQSAPDRKAGPPKLTRLK